MSNTTKKISACVIALCCMLLLMSCSVSVVDKNCDDDYCYRPTIKEID